MYVFSLSQIMEMILRKKELTLVKQNMFFNV